MSSCLSIMGAVSFLQYAAFLTFFLFGVATALDTLGSQAYGAARSGVS